MATPTYDLLESVTLATAASSVTFSSIDQSYGDLIVSFACQGSSSARVNGNFNGDTGSNYNGVVAEVDGSASSSSSTNETFFNAGLVRSNEIANNHFSVMDYSATDKHKSILQRENAALARLGMRAMRWASTAAVTSIVITNTNGTFDVGSTFNLYGVAN